MPTPKDNPRDLDELYGLEPVIEPADDGVPAPEGVQPQTVQCPYCGEAFEAVVDASSGSTSYIEDCQVCCQPIEFKLDVAEDGRLVSLETYRSD